MTRRLTSTEKHYIANSAISDNFKKDERDKARAELVEQSKAYYHSVVGDYLDTMKALPKGFLSWEKELVVTIKGEVVFLPLGEVTPMPMFFLSPDIELDPKENKALIKAVKAVNSLEEEAREAADNLYMSVVGPSTTVQGLIKRFPDAYKYFPDTLNSEFKEFDGIRKMVTGV